MLPVLHKIIKKISDRTDLPADFQESVDMLCIVSEQFINDFDALKAQFKLKDNEYQQLEQAVQKGENAIRMHIRLQSQMKLHSDFVQDQLDNQMELSEDILNENKKLLKDSTEENVRLSDLVRQLQQEIQRIILANKKLVKQYATKNHNTFQGKDIISQILQKQTKQKIEPDLCIKVLPKSHSGLLSQISSQANSLPTSLTKQTFNNEDQQFSTSSSKVKMDKRTTRYNNSVTSREINNFISKSISMKNIHAQHNSIQNIIQDTQRGIDFKGQTVSLKQHIPQKLHQIFGIYKLASTLDGGEFTGRAFNKQIQHMNQYQIDSKR